MKQDRSLVVVVVVVVEELFDVQVSVSYMCSSEGMCTDVTFDELQKDLSIVYTVCFCCYDRRRKAVVGYSLYEYVKNYI